MEQYRIGLDHGVTFEDGKVPVSSVYVRGRLVFDGDFSTFGLVAARDGYVYVFIVKTDMDISMPVINGHAEDDKH